ncbi:hydrogen gas-evolving membrane-bound hydrogenase subunit E [Haloimpatiens sp. FM7330]|uniref:hydrogen gas-evolving membrane-bound hydrogenase subunit E n=1 Tax=Haloimpatiens sp. FM7330 TaxID=3298610 RepID=UPI00363AEE05
MKKGFAWFSLVVIFIFGCYVCIKMAVLPSTYHGIANLIVKDTLQKTGAINSVTAVVFDFRGYDTLGESFVLFTAITGSAAILRKSVKAKGGKQSHEK